MAGRLRRRVLIVEDQAEVMTVLKELLLRHDYEVAEARNGVQALVALTAPEGESPDLVLLDLGLPLESGTSVLAFLRKVMRSRLPVIVLTGRQDPDEEDEARAMGISEYLRKPASPDQILSAIAQAIR